MDAERGPRPEAEAGARCRWSEVEAERGPRWSRSEGPRREAAQARTEAEASGGRGRGVGTGVWGVSSEPRCVREPRAEP